MLLINTYIAPSNTQGVGLFAGENIKKGSTIWVYHKNTTQILMKSQFIKICQSMSKPAILEFLDHSYLRNGIIYSQNDKAKFINNSMTPNIALKSDRKEVAICDIEKGQEITENYSLSYDKNDFYFWDHVCLESKETILSYLCTQFQTFGKPKTNFSLTRRSTLNN